MKKIMFNDRYRLTEAVLEGRKTMTRRIVHGYEGKNLPYGGIDGTKHLVIADNNKLFRSVYGLGDVVAVAQKYKDIPNPFYGRATDYSDAAGWNNKMFARAELMPHQIRITNVRIERLQDISDEDCLREGIQACPTPDGLRYVAGGVTISHHDLERIATGECQLANGFATPREAFAALIDKTCGKGTLESNPYVFVYEFELVK